MAVAKWYPKGRLNINRALINLQGGDIAVMLSDSSIPPDESHEFVADILNEIAGQGYIAGGKSLQNKILFIDSPNSKVVLDADDLVWANATISARYVHIYERAGGYLIGYIDAGQDVSCTNDNFTITWPASGVIADTMVARNS